MLQRPCAGMVNFEQARPIIMVRAFDGTEIPLNLGIHSVNFREIQGESFR
jgi:hypothetical protein